MRRLSCSSASAAVAAAVSKAVSMSKHDTPVPEAIREDDDQPEAGDPLELTHRVKLLLFPPYPPPPPPPPSPPPLFFGFFFIPFDTQNKDPVSFRETLGSD